MTLKLTGRDEPKCSYQEFFGCPTKEMSLLMGQGLIQFLSPELSADVNLLHAMLLMDGDIIIFLPAMAQHTIDKIMLNSLDAELLREISPDTKLDNYATVLSEYQWEDLYGNDVLYLAQTKWQN